MNAQHPPPDGPAARAAYEHARDLARQAAAHHARTDRLLLALTDVLDSFDRLLAGPAEDGRQVPPDSVRAVARQLERVVRDEGLEPVGTLGERADPVQHHVVDVRQQPGAGDDEVVEVVRRGYRFQGRLLRPARVVVAEPGGTGPSADSADTERQA